MKTNKETFEPLVLPANEIGWSDESFDLAVRYIMHHTNLAEVRDMQEWVFANIPEGILWGYVRQFTAVAIFKRPMLLSFRNFEPSVMERAFNEIKQHPRPNLQLRNTLYTIRNIAFGVLVVGSAGVMIMWLL